MNVKAQSSNQRITCVAGVTEGGERVGPCEARYAQENATRHLAVGSRQSAQARS